MKLIKRNGAEVIFDRDKITAAILKANEAVDEDERITAGKIRKIAARHSDSRRVKADRILTEGPIGSPFSVSNLDHYSMAAGQIAIGKPPNIEFRGKEGARCKQHAPEFAQNPLARCVLISADVQMGLF